MFLRMLRCALLRQKRKLVMIAVTMALGVSLSTAMLNVMMDVEEKVNQELKVYGANLNVVPRGASLLGDLYGIEDGAGIADKYILEEELPKMKTVFWAYNIVDFAPYLEMPVSIDGTDAKISLVGTWFDKHLDLPTGYAINTGISKLKSWWEVSGSWVRDSDKSGAMVGSLLAAKFRLSQGDRLTLRTPDGKTAELVIRATLHSGGPEDEQIFVPLQMVQALSNREGLVQRVDVSALTTPENELARRAATDPASLTRKEWDAWYCTAYISSIAYQIEEVLTNVRAKPVLQVSESEGGILNKIKLLMLLLTGMSMLCAALGISNLVTMNVMERNKEIGMMKAVGATDMDVILLIMGEILLTAIIGGCAGYFAGLGFAQMVGYTVFGASVDVQPIVIPIVAMLSVLVTILGSLPALRMLLSLQPAEVLYDR
ncbi:ABC transporter permease [Oxalobacter vibrioformis]|uniref:ABC transporter permease n=1 Tax=Oxalobacter vibrioformis TaxID=933080 RepID=A0A9E9P3C6_9BURK|nr:ABC transporter permease [Oxalobacter vibrioformis]WAW09016.1 ABC transporter permease [Oxalobacter vibrioformis]